MNFYRFLRETIKKNNTSVDFIGGTISGIGGFCLGAIDAHKKSENYTYEYRVSQTFFSGCFGTAVCVTAWVLLPVTILVLSTAGISHAIHKYNTPKKIRYVFDEEEETKKFIYNFNGKEDE